MQSERVGLYLKSYCKGLEVDGDFIATAYDRWRHNEAGRKNHWRVDREFGGKDNLIAEIARDVRERTLSFPMLETAPRRDSGKTRDIGIESVKQQVCGYVVDLALDDLMAARIGFWQVSVKGKSQFRAARAASRWMRRCRYHLHGDVRKCYDSIMCDVVMRILSRYVRSADILYIAEAILASYPGGHLMIGSYFSMRMAQLVMSFAYHHVESLHKVRRGKHVKLVAHQIVYADDIWLYGNDKRGLKSAMRSLERYLRDELGLTIKPWKVCRSGEDEPSDVAGAVARPGRVTVRDKTFLKGRRALLRFQRKPNSLRLARRLASYFGWWHNTDCVGFMHRNGVYAAMAAARRLVSKHDRRLATCQ